MTASSGKPKNKDSQRVDTDNGVWMAYINDDTGETVHLATPYEDIEHNKRLGVDLISPIVTQWDFENDRN